MFNAAAFEFSVRAFIRYYGPAEIPVIQIVINDFAFSMNKKDF